MASAAPSVNNSLVLVGIVGRPSDYDEETATVICERIAAGEVLTEICADDDMPNARTVSRWLMRHDDFARLYAHAREAQMHVEADQIRSLSDSVQADSDCVAKARLQVDARKWRAERLNRRVYGNSTKHEIDVAVHPANGPEQLPPGLDWLARQLPASDAAARSEPDDSGVGEK